MLHFIPDLVFKHDRLDSKQKNSAD